MFVGLNDTDGGFQTRIRFRDNKTIYYECLMQIGQQEENIDVLYSCEHTVGLGKVYEYQRVLKIKEIENNFLKKQGALVDPEVESELPETSKNTKNTCVYRLDLGTQQGRSFNTSFLEKHLPVMPSKFFDYCILSVLLRHMSLNYWIFEELSSLEDLEVKNEVLKVSSFSDEQKADASKIACIHLNNSKSSKQLTSLNKKMKFSRNLMMLF